MEIRRNLLLAIWVLLAINVLVCLGAIGLFTRMSPAISHILEENVYSIEAAEEMLAVLVKSRLEPTNGKDRQAFRAALDRARQNITEPEEVPVIEQIEKNTVQAFQGNKRAFKEILQNIRQLTEVNRKAMEKEDQKAKRLGETGAWAAVFVAILAVFLATVTLRRTDRQILMPLKEIYQVLKANKMGEKFRRCETGTTPAEIREMAHDINALLDEKGNSRTSATRG